MNDQTKYWIDYTQFITTTEKLTGLSPSELIDRYEILVKELENGICFECIYEDMQDKYTVTKIHKILDQEELKNNCLKKEFEKKVMDFDDRVRPFLFKNPKTENDWWIDFKQDKIDWKSNVKY